MTRKDCARIFRIIDETRMGTITIHKVQIWIEDQIDAIVLNFLNRVHSGICLLAFFFFFENQNY